MNDRSEVIVHASLSRSVVLCLSANATHHFRIILHRGVTRLFRKQISVSLFTKYFLSYILIFLIPFFVFGFVLYNHAVVNLKSEIETVSVNQLNQVKNMVDTRVQELNNIAFRMSYDHRLMPYTVRSNGYQTKEAIEELRKYAANSGIIDLLLLFFRGDDVIYSSDGIYSIQNLANYIDPFMTWTEEQLNRDLNDITVPFFRVITASTDQKFIAYMYPVRPKEVQYYGTVVFLIKESVFQEQIHDILGEHQGNVYMLDAHHQILASTYRGVDLQPEEFMQRIESGDAPVIQSVEVGRTEYSAIAVRSDMSQWTFIKIMPKRQFLSRVVEVQTLLLLISVFLVVVVLGIALYLSFRHLRPIKEIKKYMQERLHQSKAAKEDDLKYIGGLFRSVWEQQEHLMEKVHAQNRLVRDQNLIKLVKGRLKSKEEAQIIYENQEWLESGSVYFVMLVSWSEPQQVSFQQKEDIIHSLSRVDMPEASGYGVELIDTDAIAVVLCRKRDPLLHVHQHSAAHRILKILKGVEDISYKIGIGRPVEDILLVNRSYIEASTALAYGDNYHTKEILFFDDIKENNEKVSWYPMEELMKFNQSLKNGDETVAIETLSIMIESISRQQQSLLLLKCMCYEIMNRVLKTITELKIDHLTDEIKEVLDFRTLNEFEQKLKHFICTICKIVEDHKENHNQELQKRILDYIDRHYYTYDFSLERLARQFELSVPYASRFIKEQTGSTFMEHTIHLRMEKAKSELANTNKPIKQIVLDTGYTDVSNFTRKFRETVGMTPSQYRHKYK